MWGWFGMKFIDVDFWSGECLKIVLIGVLSKKEINNKDIKGFKLKYLVILVIIRLFLLYMRILKFKV